MPKIEDGAANSGAFLIDGKPYPKGFYAPSVGGELSDPKIKFYEIGGGSDKRLAIVTSNLSEYTDNNDAGFATLNDLYTYLQSISFFLKASAGGGGIPNPSPTGEGELISINGTVEWDTRPYTVDPGTDDARFKGDVYASGEFFAQQNSTNYANNIKVGVTGDKLVITDQDNGKQSLIAKNEITAGESNGMVDTVRYDPFTKNDPLGQPQPDDSLTFNSSPFVEDLTGETKYYYQITLQSTSTIVTDVWYVKCPTGLTNSYIYIYKGAVDFSTLTGQQDTKYWTTNSEKDIKSKTNLVTGSGTDITYPLGNTFFEKEGEIFTYVVVADNNYTTKGQTISGIDVPYITGDGSRWGQINTSSKLIVNGNLTPNEFNSTLQLSNNATEYYGCSILLEAGRYKTVEVPYKNRSSTSAPAYLYAILLDQNDNTIAYKRLYVGQNASTEGSFSINFDNEILVETSGIYQMVIGRRKWNQGNRQADIFQKDVNSSDGSVWLARGDQQNPSLNADDTSAVDWSTIQKQNYNKIPKALIYKF